MKKRGLLFVSVLVIGMGMSMPAQCGDKVGGVLGSLLSDDGLVNTLLGEDGVVNSVLHDEKAMETIGGLFEGDGPLAGILPEDVDVSGVLESVGSKLGDAGSVLQQGLESVAEMATNEDGSIDWEKVEGSAEELIGMITGGGAFGGSDEPESEEDWDAYLAEIMAPYDAADAVMFDHVIENNADLMDQGDVQIVSRTAGCMNDIEDEVYKVLADFTQVNFTVDGDQMNLVSGATDTLLLSLQKGEDGVFAVIDEKRAEDGEGFEESVKALCEELGTDIDEYYSGNVLGAYNDATALAKYLREHPEIRTAEYQGEQLTADELQELADNYTDSLFDSIFGIEEEETEGVTE